MAAHGGNFSKLVFLGHVPSSCFLGQCFPAQTANTNRALSLRRFSLNAEASFLPLCEPMSSPGVKYCSRAAALIVRSEELCPVRPYL